MNNTGLSENLDQARVQRTYTLILDEGFIPNCSAFETSVLDLYIGR